MGTEIGIPLGQSVGYCPVTTLRAWIEAAGLSRGAVFRSISSADNVKAERLGDRDIARNIKLAIALAGHAADLFGGHSLRAGFATSAGRAGVPERIIMRCRRATRACRCCAAISPRIAVHRECGGHDRPLSGSPAAGSQPCRVQERPRAMT